MAKRPGPDSNLFKAMTVLGGFFIFLHNDVFYYWGNLAIYVTSYTASHVTSASDDIHPSWTYTMFSPAWVVSSVVSGYLSTFIKPRVLLVVAIVVENASFFIVYLLLDISLPAVYITFGLFVGIGCGLFEGILLQHFVLNISRDNNSLMVAVAMAGGPVGGILISQFVTWYTNPENYSPDKNLGGILLFTQDTVINKVPSMLLMIGITLSTLQILGLLLLRDVPSTKEELSIDTAPIIVNSNSYESTSTSTRRQQRSPSSNQLTDCGLPRQNGDRGFLETSTSNESGKSTDSYSTELTTDKEINSNTITVTETPDKIATPDNDNQKSYTPRELMKSKNFYKLSIVYILGVSTRLINTYYKLYGQTQIDDDHFLTNLGTAQAVIEIPATVLCGYLIDKIGVTSSVLVIYSLCPVSMLLMYFTARWDRWAYLVATLCVSILANVYAFFSIATFKWFGTKWYAINLAIIEAISNIGIVVPTLVMDSLIARFGHFSEFAWASASCVVGLVVIALSFPRSRQ